MYLTDRNNRRYEKNIVQYLGSSKSENKTFICLSDGTLKIEAIATKDFLKKFQGVKFAAKTILLAEFRFLHKNVFFIQDAEIVYPSVPFIIGNPILYSELEDYNFFNDKASNVIPESVWNKSKIPLITLLDNGDDDDEDELLNRGNEESRMAIVNIDFENAHSIKNNIKRDSGNQIPKIPATQINFSNFNSMDKQKTPKAPKIARKNSQLSCSQIDDIMGTLGNFTLISLIDIKFRNWNCKGICIRKSNLRPFIKKNGKFGCFFTCEFQDDSGIIKATFFEEEAFKFNKIIKESRVYEFQKFKVQVASKWNKTNNLYELMATGRSEVNISVKDSSIPDYKLDFTKIEKINKKYINFLEAKNTEISRQSQKKILSLSVAGKVLEVTLNRSVNLKDGRKSIINDILMADSNKHAIKVSVWGTFPQFELIQPGLIILAKDFRVNEYQGSLSLSSFSNSRIILSPSSSQYAQIQELRELPLREAPTRNSNSFKRQSKLLSIAKGVQKTTTEIEGGESTAFFDVSCKVMGFGDSLLYESCPLCRKKVQLLDDHYVCVTCDSQTQISNTKFCFQVYLQDYTGRLRATILKEEVGCEVFGMDPNKLKLELMKYHQETGSYENSEFLEQFLGKTLSLTLMAYINSYQGKESIRYRVIRCKASNTPFEISFNNKDLLSSLKGMITQKP